MPSCLCENGDPVFVDCEFRSRPYNRLMRSLIFPLPLALFLVSFVNLLNPRVNAAVEITVAAGNHDRRNAIVLFDLPAAAREVNHLQTADGLRIPLQVDGRGRATFILESLAKNSTRSYQLIKAEKLADGQRGEVKAERMGTVLKLTVDNRPALHYQAEQSELPRADLKPVFRRGGYLHPVYSPSGLMVTDDYPSNHKHHHGIWFPWTKTVFEGREPDFWNMGDGKGTVEFVVLDRFWSGPVHGGFRARHRFTDLTAPEPKAVLNEVWEVRLYRLAEGEIPFRLFELTSTQQCAGATPLKLPQYHYGGLGVRGHWDWNGPENTTFLTAEGETDRVKGNSTRGRWCHMGGKTDGKLTGITILGHPDNFRAPQPMRLHPSEPFFCFAPSQLGDWEIAPGQLYVSRYRFAVFDGPADRELIERLWSDYAYPPKVTIESQ